MNDAVCDRVRVDLHDEVGVCVLVRTGVRAELLLRLCDGRNEREADCVLLRVAATDVET